MTTFGPDTQEQDPGMLRAIVQQFGGTLSLNGYVIQPGDIGTGDPV